MTPLTANRHWTSRRKSNALRQYETVATAPVASTTNTTMFRRVIFFILVQNVAVQPEPGFPAIGWDRWFCSS
jgi:hypothetical protein